MATSSHLPAAGGASTTEAHESLANRNSAVKILQSYEKLSWISFERRETIHQTRLHFQNIVAGFTPEDEDRTVRWREDFAKHPKPPENPAGESSKKKGKQRVSSGGSGVPGRMRGGSGGDAASKKGSGSSTPKGKSAEKS